MAPKNIYCFIIILLIELLFDLWRTGKQLEQSCRWSATCTFWIENVCNFSRVPLQPTGSHAAAARGGGDRSNCYSRHDENFLPVLLLGATIHTTCVHTSTAVRVKIHLGRCFHYSYHMEFGYTECSCQWLIFQTFNIRDHIYFLGGGGGEFPQSLRKIPRQASNYTADAIFHILSNSLISHRMTEIHSGVATFYGGRREKSQWLHLRDFKYERLKITIMYFISFYLAQMLNLKFVEPRESVHFHLKH